MTFNIPWNKRTIQVLLALYDGAKGIQDVQEAVGGSYVNVYKSLGELNRLGLISDESLIDPEHIKTMGNKHWFSITAEGRKLVESLLNAGFLRMPALKKDRQKWIILILNSLNTVVGKTRLMKIMFLLRHETGRWRGSFFRYKAWDYGPYSQQLDRDLEDLQRDNLILVETSKFHRSEFSDGQSVCYTYALTSKGKALVPQLLAECPSNSMQKIEKLHPFNRMPLLELLRHVYERYREFIRNSKIVDRVLGNQKDE